MTHPDLSFHWDWLPPFDAGSVEAATFAELKIALQEHVATELEDLQSQTLRESLLASAYPLAMFLAANWWRLRWEPAPARESAEWRMSHSLAAAGGGYAWPDLTFASDGDSVCATMTPGPKSATAPVRYVADFAVWIPATAFEAAVTELVEGVIARLRTLRMGDTDLATLWAEVLAERADPLAARWRRLEALAGYDADEAPEALVDGLIRAAERVGWTAVDELAAASRGDALQDLDRLRDALRSGERFRIAELDRLRREMRAAAPESVAAPWQRAARSAALARAVWGLDGEPLGNDRLSELTGIPVDSIESRRRGARIPDVPYSASECEEESETMRLVLHRRPVTSRRFALCRLIADRLYGDAMERLSAATDARTNRQKFQRAFAQELLCPFESLMAFLDGKVPQDDDIDEAAEHFRVSPLVVRTALVNRGVLPSEVLDGQR